MDLTSSLRTATPRRKFLARIVKSIHTAITAIVGVVVGGAILSPVFGRREENWLTAATCPRFPKGGRCR